MAIMHYLVALCSLAAAVRAQTTANVPTCKAGYSLTVDTSGACGSYRCECTGTTAAACTDNAFYCPCPFLYSDTSAKNDGSVCKCNLAAVCGSACPPLYKLQKGSCTRTIVAIAPGADVAPQVLPGTGGGTATPPTSDTAAFNISLVNFGTPQQYVPLFEAAAAHWSSIITAEISDVGPMPPAQDKGWFAGYFGAQGDYAGPVDDLVIGYRIGAIDGAGGPKGNILAESAPVYTRSDPTDPSDGLPISGIMDFDQHDLQSLEGDGSLDEVILHEMGHVLGIGSLWPTPAKCAKSCNVYNTGATSTCFASEEFTALGLAGQLKVENQGTQGDGTYCSHWNEAQLGDELMTGVLDAGGWNPLTAISIGGLKDLGYSVDYSKAQPLVEPAARRALREAEEAVSGPRKRNIRHVGNDVRHDLIRPFYRQQN